MPFGELYSPSSGWKLTDPGGFDSEFYQHYGKLKLQTFLDILDKVEKKRSGVNWKGLTAENATNFKAIFYKQCAN